MTATAQTATIHTAPSPVHEFLTNNKDLLLGLTLALGLMIVLAVMGGADAQTIDTMTNNVGSKFCAFAKSIEKSVLIKGLAGLMIAFGLVKWIPTRKDGIPEIVGGGIGWIIASKFTVVTSLFGLSC